MKKPIDVSEIRTALGRIWRQLVTGEERPAIKRDGRPAAVMVPAGFNEQRKRGRESLFEKLERAQAQPELSPAEADALAREAVKAVRSDYLR
jgi:antitoxin (DNA-binding transcriptional repressor) of toxin-antitoxin stability system